MDILSKFPTSGIGFVLTLVFGFWLSKLGKPYNGILFNIHKLIALSTVVIVAMQVYGIFRSPEHQPLIVVLIIVTAICVVALFASGAFMSIGNLNYRIMLTIHRIALALVFIATAVIIYLLAERTS
jgi:hypothetical protein